MLTVKQIVSTNGKETIYEARGPVRFNPKQPVPFATILVPCVVIENPGSDPTYLTYGTIYVMNSDGATLARYSLESETKKGEVEAREMSKAGTHI
jgi:hypothetical protein